MPVCPPVPWTLSSAIFAIPPTLPGSPIRPEGGCCTATPSPLYRHATDAGDGSAARQLADLLTQRGDLDGATQILRARADIGDEDAARQLADLLAQRGDLDGLRARANAGDEDAARRLADLLIKQGRDEEAERLRRFGLNPDGSIARA